MAPHPVAGLGQHVGPPGHQQQVRDVDASPSPAGVLDGRRQGVDAQVHPDGHPVRLEGGPPPVDLQQEHRVATPQVALVRAEDQALVVLPERDPDAGRGVPALQVSLGQFGHRQPAAGRLLVHVCLSSVGVSAPSLEMAPVRQEALMRAPPGGGGAPGHSHPARVAGLSPRRRPCGPGAGRRPGPPGCRRPCTGPRGCSRCSPGRRGAPGAYGWGVGAAAWWGAQPEGAAHG